jgi:hypothetical protein
MKGNLALFAFFALYLAWGRGISKRERVVLHRHNKRAVYT